MSYMYIVVHVVTSWCIGMFWNILVLRDATHDATLLFWLWRHCMVYWNANVPNLRAQHKMVKSQIFYEIYIVNRYYLLIHKVHEKFHLNLNSFETPPRLMGQWTNSNICRTVTDGPFLHANMSNCTFIPKKKNPYWGTKRVTWGLSIWQLTILLSCIRRINHYVSL